MTPSVRKALEWFADRTEPVSLFGRDTPTLLIVKRMEAAGLLEKVKGNARAFGGFMFTAYQISQAGRDALAAKPKPRERRLRKD